METIKVETEPGYVPDNFNIFEEGLEQHQGLEPSHMGVKTADDNSNASILPPQQQASYMNGYAGRGDTASTGSSADAMSSHEGSNSPHLSGASPNIVPNTSQGSGNNNNNQGIPSTTLHGGGRRVIQGPTGGIPTSGQDQLQQQQMMNVSVAQSVSSNNSAMRRTNATVTASMTALHISNQGQQSTMGAPFNAPSGGNQVCWSKEEDNLEHMLLAADDLVSKLVDEEPKNALGGMLQQQPLHNQHMQAQIKQPANPSAGFMPLLPPQGQVEDDHQWFYTDPQREVQGPFSAMNMISWYNNGYFADNLLLRRDCDEKFAKLGDLKLIFGRVPFFPGPPVAPLKKKEPDSETDIDDIQLSSSEDDEKINESIDRILYRRSSCQMPNGSEILNIHQYNESRPATIFKRSDSVSSRDSGTGVISPNASNENIRLKKSRKRRRTDLGPPPYKCSECAYVSDHQGNVAMHFKAVHLKEKDYKCSSCEFSTTYKYKLNSHMKIVHLKEKPYKCSLCDYSTGYNQHLRHHFKVVHLEDTKLFKCSQCGVYASSKRSLMYHVKSAHSSEEIFKCSECEGEFSSESTLAFHMKSKHSKKTTPQSSEGGYCTDSKESFGMYTQVDHSSEKPESLATLTKAIHSRDKPFKCSECEYRTSRGPNLAMHVKSVHLKENLLKCSECEYVGNSKEILSSHVQAIHCKSKPIKCSQCQFYAPSEKLMAFHVKATHSKKK